jgi:Dyp-type peroxidase family
MSKQLDLYDIQGNICKGYGRYGYPKARYSFLRFNDAKQSRLFLLDLIKDITTSEAWEAKEDSPNKPVCTTNIGFTYSGLEALGIPERSLKGFPVDFTEGMKARSHILGDTGKNSSDHWDEIWQDDNVHAWLSINARDSITLGQRHEKLIEMIADFSGVEILSGHRGPDGNTLNYQDASAVYQNGYPTGKEHFGFSDGISNPFFEGNGHKISRLPGRGKLMRDGSWKPLATGEFILGHIDEAKEYPIAPDPKLLSYNGTFMVYRKLHENVDTFAKYIDDLAKDFDGSKDLLMAKMAGRWPDNGAPLTLAPTDDDKAVLDSRMADLKHRAQEGEECAIAQLKELRREWTNFDYDDDKSGSKCPIGAHVRRTNTRGSLEHEKGAFARPGALVDRRRIMRRGLPYGGVDETPSDSAEQGIIFMCVGASIERQFEFVQQQWVNYSNDFKLGNDKDPIIGNHNGNLTDKHIIQAEEKKLLKPVKAPFFCTEMPSFVETRGGDYFFIPSVTALRMIAEEMIDPS